MPRASGSPLSTDAANALRLLERDVRRQRRHVGIGHRLEHARAGRRASAASQAWPTSSGWSTRMPAQAERLGVAPRTGSRGMSCDASNFGSPAIARMLPGHLVQVAVVEHQDDEARVRPLASSTCAMVISSLMPFICIAPSPTSAITGRSGIRELGRDRVGHAGAHRGQVARQRAPSCPRAELQVARVPVGRRAGVGGEDAVVGQPRRQLPEDALRVDRVGRRSSRAPRAPATSRATLSSICSRQRAVRLALAAAAAARAASPRCRRRRLTSIG